MSTVTAVLWLLCSVTDGKVHCNADRGAIYATMQECEAARPNAQAAYDEGASAAAKRLNITMPRERFFCARIEVGPPAS